jgi:electron transport complex protein RnfG
MLDILRLTLVLTFVASLAGLAIGLTHTRTEPLLQERQGRYERQLLQSLFPAGADIVAQRGSTPLPSRYWKVRKDGRLIGYAFEDSSQGYSKPIELMVAVDTTAKVLGVRIVSHNETPGVGSRIQEALGSQPLWQAHAAAEVPRGEPWFTRQFTNLDISRRITVDQGREWPSLSESEKAGLTSSNSVTAVSGATISTRAVINAVSASIPKYVSQLQGERNGQ